MIWQPANGTCYLPMNAAKPWFQVQRRKAKIHVDRSHLGCRSWSIWFYHKALQETGDGE